MINVSNEFRQLMNTRTDFKQNAEIKLADGTELSLSEKDFTIANNSVVDGSDISGIPLGVAVCRSIQIELMNDEDQFSSYDFFGAVIRLYLTYQLSATVERIEYGTFTVLTPETYGETVIITALDDMHKADRDYTTNLSYPATLRSILVDACDTLDIPQGTVSFYNDDFVVNQKPEGITFRQLLGYIAMIAGGNARIDTTGRLQIITYDFVKLDAIFNSILDGGRYNPWNELAVLDGGNFSPWNTGDEADGGLYGDRNTYHVLGNWSNLKTDTDDVVITGIKTVYTNSDNEDVSVMYGDDGYVLQVENPLIVGQEEEAINLIGNIMVGGRFRQFSGDMIADPTCEFMDSVVIVSRKGNAYVSFLTDINFQFFGFTTVKNSAEPALRNSSKAYSEATKTLVEARKLIKSERTAREQAVQQLAKELSESSGLFMTEEMQEDGSTVYYMHDKPTLAESMVVWKLTALAFGISTDGGKTYPYGFTVNGELITKLLYAEGIDADYINTGAIRISDTSENVLFLADYNTKQVQINADKVLIGSSTVKEYVDSVGSSLQSQIDGNIETFTGTEVPTLSNYPANQWTTTAVKDKHIGDLYYVSESSSTQGFAYRFQKSGTTYSWVLIKDSEVTKALQDAAEAFEKANEVGANLELNYSTTAEMNSAIEASSNQINLSVSETYTTKAELFFEIEGLWDYANLLTNDLELNYSKTTEIQSMIELESSNIQLAVREKYETIINSDKKYSELTSSININANSIASEVTRAENAEKSLSSKITQTAESIELKVSKGDVSSQLSVESGKIDIKSNRFSWESTYSSLTAQGKLTATDVDLTGKITAESGKIGGFDIKSTYISNGKASMYASSSGVYIGTDGISVGPGSTTGTASFAVTNDGKIYLGYNSQIQSKGDLVFEDTCVIKYGTAGTNHIRFSSDGIVIGGLGGKIGFFSAVNAGSTKKTVSNLTSPTTATASTIAAKLNELLTALRAYNLIG